MIKIFYKDKTIILTKDTLFTNFYLCVNISDSSCIEKLLNFLSSDEKYTFNIHGDTEEHILYKIKQQFKVISAAGGVVFNKNNAMLFIKRLGWMDLPKGKKENGESNKQTAIREVCEECGILDKDLVIKNFLQFGFHIYFKAGSFILKETAWYEMQFSGNYELKPQTEEGITEIKWLDKMQIPDYKNLLYPALIDLINCHFGIL